MFLIKKIFWSKKHFGYKIIHGEQKKLVSENFGQRKFLVRENFWSGKIFDQQKLLVSKNFWSAKIFGQRNFCQQKF